VSPVALLAFPTMTKRKKTLSPEFKIYKAGGDLTKKWFVYYYEGSKRIRKYEGINEFHTPSGREAAAKKLIKKLKQDHFRKVSRVEEVIWDYIEANTSRWKPKTIQQYKSSANVLLEFLGGRVPTEQLISDFLEKIKIEKHPTTYNRYLFYTKRLMDEAGYAFLLEGFSSLKTNKTPARYFQKYQATKLLTTIDEKDPELGLFIRYIYYCFIRPNELRQLTVGDILLEEMEIRIPGTISKNRKTQYIVIPAAFQNQLKSLYHKPPGVLLFSSKNNDTKPVGKSVMYRRHQKFLKLLNFGVGYTLYSWKHTGAVAAAKAGISIKELQLQLRHHSLDETDKYLRQMGVKDLSQLSSKFPGI
jgi:integrase